MVRGDITEQKINKIERDYQLAISTNEMNKSIIYRKINNKHSVEPCKTKDKLLNKYRRV